MAYHFDVIYLAVMVCAKAYLVASCPSIVSRTSWGATPASPANLKVNPPAMVFIHHTDTLTCTSLAACSQRLKNIQYYHMNDRKPETFVDIGYSFLIGGDGAIYEGRGWGKEGAHTKGFNDKSIGIALVGNFSSSPPSVAMQNAAKDLIACGVSLGKISTSYKLYGHRQGVSTSCPGDGLYSLIKPWKNWSPEYVYSTSRCVALKGKCQEDNAPCSGRYVSSKCPGPANVKCCTPP